GTWRDRLQREDTLRWVKDQGVDVLITYCYKGFGLAIEREQWPDLRRFVDRAHDAGMRVFGYVQGRGLFQETLRAEVPDFDDWVARQHDGSPMRWAYYRLSPCLTSE